MNSTETVNKAFVADEIITIDPGKSNGGICKFSDGRYESWPIRKIESFEHLVDFMRYQAEICRLPLVVIEKITTFSSDLSQINMTPEERDLAIKRNYQLNRMKDHYVELIAAVKLSKMQFIEVMPHVWQSYLKILIKNEDYEIRKRRYKDIASDWFAGTRVVGWNADALLMIEFTRKKLKYEQRWIHQHLNKNKVKSKSLFQ